jgi:glycerophosphoryl diester phosphodiesterase
MTFICAHRGASGHAPENTLAALKLAAEQGAEMAEIDVQLTRDGQVVVIHDESLDRTTDGTGPVAAHTLQQVRQRDAGSWFAARWQGEKVPSLALLLVMLGRKLRWNIELKAGASPDLEEAVLARLAATGCTERALVTSFDHGRIDRLAAGAAPVDLGYIVGPVMWRDELLDASVPVLSVERSLATADRVARAHRAGKQIHVWTVNEPDEMVRLLELQVDAIITNYPDRLQAIRCSR